VASTTTTSASPQLVSGERAIERVTRARCTRQLACGFIGTDQFYDDYDGCSRDLREATREFLLGSSACTAGIDEWALSTCLNDIREDPCGDMHGTVESIASCAMDKLCR
jgi:hypothetical protein